MAINERYRLRILWSWNGLAVSTGFAYKQTQVLHDFTAWKDDVVEWWNTGYTSPTVAAAKTFYSTVVTLTGVESRNLDVPTEPPELFVQDPAIAGTGGSTPMSPKTAVVATVRTALIGRRFRGRMYLPAMDDAVSDAGGRLSSTNATTLADSVVRMFDSLNTDGAQPGVFSKAGGDIFTPYNDVAVGRDFDVQRRRRYRPEAYFT